MTNPANQYRSPPLFQRTYTKINTIFLFDNIFIYKINLIMKRLIISEDERRRILSMHESATKRQYLGEQENVTPDATVSKPNFGNYIPTNAERDAFVAGINNINGSTEADLLKLYEGEFLTKLRKILQANPQTAQMLPTTGDNWKQWYVDNKLGNKTVTGDVQIDIAAALPAVKKIFLDASKMYDFDAIDKALSVMYQYAKQTENPTLRDPNFKTLFQKSGLSNDIFTKANTIGQIFRLIGPQGDLTPMKNLS